jgi:hypothetical protein
MIRTQIQLTEEQSRRVKEIAEREEISMAEVIRQAVDHWITMSGDLPPEERRRRALSVVGRFSSGLGDISVNHDAYLAEAYGDYEPRDDLP